MIKARNRKIALLLVLAMLMTMFVGIGTVSAKTIEFNTISAPQITAGIDEGYQTLGKVSVDIPDVRAFSADGEWLTISLPAGCEFDGNVYDGYEAAGLLVQPTGNISIDPNYSIKTAKNTVELLVYGNPADTDTEYDGSILLTFGYEEADVVTGILVKSGSGNIDAKFLSNGGVFGPLHTATIAKIGEGSTTVAAKSVKTIGDAGGEIDTILIAENNKGVFEPGEEFELRLPKGFSWSDPNQGVVMGAWSLFGAPFDYVIDEDNPRIMTFIYPYQKTTSAARINVGTSAGFFSIEVEDTAKYGDVNVTVKSNKDSVAQTEVLVATYGDFGVKVVEGTKEQVTSGRKSQEIGKFYLQESVAQSLVAGRSLYFELPEGVEWQTDDEDVDDDGVTLKEPVLKLVTDEGTPIYMDYNAITFVNNSDNRKVKVDFSFQGDSSTFSDEAAKLLIKDAEVKVSPTFEGDIKVTVSGSTGAKGDVVVANAVKPVKIAAENATKVEIGAMKQKAGDILITETMDEGILDDPYKRIQIDLPRGVYFANEPTVTVESGDLEIDETSLEDTVSNQDGSLLIIIKATSSKASVIRISNINLTVDRTVPEGTVPAKFVGANFEYDKVQVDYDEYIDVVDYDETTGSTAFVDWDNDDSIGSVIIATTITPKEGAATVFKVNSNIYTVNGVSKVMDAAPYIKNGRTFVPMRYLGEALGAEVAWDATAKTVTLTKGSTVVVFTVGSTTYTVNGESKTAEVAPEIVNDRTMLPARYVAEAFGATVGWDAATGTVLIQQ